MLTYIKEIGSGFIVGVANIIPGVSGGTLLFLLGLYERTLGALSKFNAKSVTALLRSAFKTIFSSKRKESLKLLGEQAQALDIPYIIRLLAGAAAAIILLSGLMEYLLETHFSSTYAFFFGLILMSAVLSVKMMKRIKPIHLIHIVIGAAITVLITASVDPATTAKKKSERYEEEYAESVVSSAKSTGSTVSAELAESAVTAENRATKPESARFKYTGRYTAWEIAVASAAGAIAICVMILPGLSGSLILILLGQYHEVISAISGLKTLQLDYVVFLTIMAIGMGFGLLAFARLVNFVFKRFYDDTVAVMIGLILGSLYALWPFKKVVVEDLYVKTQSGITFMKGEVIETNMNILPPDVTTGLLALLFCGVGIVIMVLLDRHGGKHETEIRPVTRQNS
jgi:putative membrane protein